jgi:hypothetical protein
VQALQQEPWIARRVPWSGPLSAAVGIDLTHRPASPVAHGRAVPVLFALGPPQHSLAGVEAIGVLFSSCAHPLHSWRTACPILRRSAGWSSGSLLAYRLSFSINPRSRTTSLIRFQPATMAVGFAWGLSLPDACCASRSSAATPWLIASFPICAMFATLGITQAVGCGEGDDVGRLTVTAGC